MALINANRHLIRTLIIQILFRMFMSRDNKELTIEEQNLLLNNRLSDLTAFRSTRRHIIGFKYSQTKSRQISNSFVTSRIKLDSKEAIDKDIAVTDPMRVESWPHQSNLSQDIEQNFAFGNSTDDNDSEDVMVMAAAPDFDPILDTNVGTNDNKTTTNTTESINLKKHENESLQLDNDDGDVILEKSAPNSSVTIKTIITTEQSTPKQFHRAQQTTIPELINLLVVMEVTTIGLLVICWLLTWYYDEDVKEDRDLSAKSTFGESDGIKTVKNASDRHQKPSSKVQMRANNKMVEKSRTPSQSSGMSFGLGPTAEQQADKSEDKKMNGQNKNSLPISELP